MAKTKTTTKAKTKPKPKAKTKPKPKTKTKLVVERTLDADEVDSIAAIALCARQALKIPKADKPEVVVRKIGAYVDAVRAKKKAMPKSEDTRMGLGALWGEQLHAQLGWTWVHLTYPDGGESYGLVPKDRSLACFPLEDLEDQLSVKTRPESTSVLLFNMLVAGKTPKRTKGAYLPFG